MKLSNYERETIILFNNEEGHATVTTYDIKTIRKLLSNKDATILDKDLEEDRVVFVKAIIPKRLISIKEKRTMSDEQRQEARDRMNNIRKDSK